MQNHTSAPNVLKSSLHIPHSRCAQCNPRRRENTRNLVVCIDGTFGHFGQNNTNVAKFFAKVDQETIYPDQYAYYSNGFGERSKALINRIERAVADKFSMAIAWNMEEVVKDVYGWLARVYQEGDQIYLFGFSRGAYQVRVLAGMIHVIGLIRMPTEKQIGTAYGHYEAIRSGKPKTWQVAREFKNTFSWRDLRVHFVGVWDTVSSVGLVRGDVFLSTSQAAYGACHFRHALALDERRVKFMPEYFHEMNSQTDDGKSKYIVTSDVENAVTPASERCRSAASGSGTDVSGEKKNWTTEIKEVWFAGSHSDVGGRDRRGKSYQAGNVSLLWMRKEATANGLVLQPTDIVWVPDDLDFGTRNSMTRVWEAIEYMPIMHQVSFSGAGENARRWHRLQPRRIIPGQKIHASILYANAYQPQASLGEGFDIPIVHSNPDTELDTRIWDTGLFDDTAAQELLFQLGNQRGVDPIHLDRLLFMLRFNEGKQYVRNVPNWQEQFANLIHNPFCAPLVRLVTIVAYYEASCDPEAHPSLASPHIELQPVIFEDARKCLCDILARHKHRDGPRVIALLRPLTKHQALRERILTQDALETLMYLFDVVISRPGSNFGQTMDALNCLLQCEDTRSIIIKKLEAIHPGANISRLSRILEVKDPYLLIAALRLVMTLSRFPEARYVCVGVKPRMKELAAKDGRLVGLFAFEILLALHDPNDRDQLDIRNLRVRANLARALVRLSPDKGDSADSGKQVLRRLFGLDAQELSELQRRLIGELKGAIQSAGTQERTAATMTILKLCETEVVRVHLLQIGLLDVFVSQLQRKDLALLAAYALVVCLKYDDMNQSLKDNELLPMNIVSMLRLDYFDDAVGQVEGFQIFGDFMQHADLRQKIMNYDITEVLNTKLGKGKIKATRTSLICLNIFRSFDQDDPWTSELVDKSLEYLRQPEWKAQKAGVSILSALARTDHGVAAIAPRIPVIIELLLPDDYLPIDPAQPTALGAVVPPDEGQAQPAAIAAEPVWRRPPSWMFGPACALRVLVQNKVLRDLVRETTQYGNLKHMYLTETLVDDVDTSPWRVRTPNRTDVIDILDETIKMIEEELSEGGLMLIGDAVLPHIRHWDQLITELRDRSLAMVTVLPALLGVSALAILTTVVTTPIYASVQAYKYFRQVGSRYQDRRILDRLRRVTRIPEVIEVGRAGEIDLDAHELEGEGGSNGHDNEAGSGHSDEDSLDDQTVGVQEGGDAERIVGPTSL